MHQALTSEEEIILNNIRSRLSEFGKQRSRIIPLLQMIQEELTYLPPAAIAIVAEHLELSESEVYGVATFYNQFRFNPPGKHPIKVCMGTACHVRGGDIILENFERKLGIAEGETTEDREYSLERVACVGCCALAPVALVGDMVQGHMAPSKVEGIITRIQIENEVKEREKRQKESSE
ncbi:MAG: NADH-quinone oxidoreductase subunit NuoE [Deltaproteobacteria bacterium]|nr:NADH-quinone oxidoreductase subunit NuoE [Deltaproteobacteria bacterium]